MQFDQLKRREFITLLVGAVVCGSLASHAEQRERPRRIGVLFSAAADDADYQSWLGAFLQALAEAGWKIGHNIRVDIRWATSDADAVRRHATELAAFAPDVILALGASTVGPLLRATRAVPIVFAGVADPVGAGFVHSLARPGGNATGFMSFEYGFGGKWLELLKEIAPGTTRVAVLRDSGIASGIGQFGVIQAIAPLLKVEVNPIDVREGGDIEGSIAEFARSGNRGLILTASGLAWARRDLIIKLAAQYRVPAVYFERAFVAAGGLVSYGADNIDLFRRAAGYIDRNLKGEKPADMPVQAPTKYELVINLKTAKALGLEIPPAVLTRADEVIE